MSEKRDIVDIYFHALCAFVLGPSLGLGIPTSWGDGTKGMMEASNTGDRRGGVGCMADNGLGSSMGVCLKHMPIGPPLGSHAPAK